MREFSFVSIADQRPNSWTYNFVEVSGHILRVLRFEVSVYNVYITNQLQSIFSPGGGGVKSVSRGDCE